MWNLKISKQTKPDRNKEQMDGCPRGGVGGKGEVVISTAISLPMTDDTRLSGGEHIIRYIYVESLCYTLETNVVLYAK